MRAVAAGKEKPEEARASGFLFCRHTRMWCVCVNVVCVCVCVCISLSLSLSLSIALCGHEYRHANVFGGRAISCAHAKRLIRPSVCVHVCVCVCLCVRAYLCVWVSLYYVRANVSSGIGRSRCACQRLKRDKEVCTFICMCLV